MASVLEALRAIDLSKLDAHLALTNGTVQGKVSVTSLDPMSLLGDLGPALKKLESLSSDPSALAGLVKQALAELESLLSLPELGSIDAVLSRLTHIGSQLESIAQHFAGHDGGTTLDGLLGPLGTLEGVLDDIASGIGKALPISIPEEATGWIAAAAKAAGGLPGDPAELAPLLAQLILGIDLGALQEIAKVEADALSRIQQAGGDFTAVHGTMAALTSEVQSIAGSIALGTLDASAAAAKFDTLSTKLDGVFGDLDRAVARIGSDISNIRLDDAFRHLLERLAPILSWVKAQEQDLEQSIVAPLRKLAERIEALGPGDLTGLIAGVFSRIQEALADSGLGVIAGAFQPLFEWLIGLLRGLPLRSLRDEVLAALLAVDNAIRGFLGFSTPHLLQDQLASLEQAIDGIDTSAITDRVSALAAQVQGLADGFPIDQIKSEIEGVVHSLSDVVGSFIPALDEAKKALDDLGGQLGSLDLQGAGRVSSDAIGQARQKVKELVSGPDVPEAAKSVLSLAAHELKSIDISVKVTAPFGDALDKLDPKIILAPIAPALAEVKATLEKATPKALVAKLDAPFEEMLNSLKRFEPSALIAQVAGRFGDFAALLDKADPRLLLQPLEAEFQKLLAAARAAIDPGPLLAPIRAAYQKLLGLIDQVDLEKLLTLLMGKMSGLGGLVGKSVGRVVAAQPGTGAPPAANPAGFKFGDLLRPVAALIAELRAAISGAAQAGLEHALALIAGPLRALVRLAAPGGLAAGLDSALQGRLALLNPAATTGPQATLRVALHDLAMTVANQDDDFRGTLDAPLLKVSLDARIDALGPRFSVLDETTRGWNVAPPPALAISLSRVSGELARLPTQLTEEATSGALAVLDALLDAIDPSRFLDELDQITDRIITKLQSLAGELLKGQFTLLDLLMGSVLGALPFGLIQVVRDGMTRVKAELAVLDPQPIEDELRQIIDGIIDGLNVYSPLRLASGLGEVFDRVKQKLLALDPTAMLGNLDPIAAVLTKFEALRPSVVLAPLTDQTQGLEAGLEKITDIDIGAALVHAMAELKTTLESVVQNVKVELDGLLDDLEGGQGGGASASISVST